MVTLIASVWAIHIAVAAIIFVISKGKAQTGSGDRARHQKSLHPRHAAGRLTSDAQSWPSTPQNSGPEANEVECMIDNCDDEPTHLVSINDAGLGLLYAVCQGHRQLVLAGKIQAESSDPKRGLIGPV